MPRCWRARLPFLTPSSIRPPCKTCPAYDDDDDHDQGSWRHRRPRKDFMIRALYTAASGMAAQELNLDNIANNLANSSTSGFRSRRLQFEDLIYQNLIMPGAAATQQTTVVAGLQVGLGTRSAASEVIQQQGDFSQTGNPLDLTIQGQGFFQVLLPDGQTAYTRAGSFHTDQNGNLVDQDGDPVQPGIAIPTGATSITVGSEDR